MGLILAGEAVVALLLFFRAIENVLGGIGHTDFLADLGRRRGGREAARRVDPLDVRHVLEDARAAGLNRVEPQPRDGIGIHDDRRNDALGDDDAAAAALPAGIRRARVGIVAAYDAAVVV